MLLRKRFAVIRDELNRVNGLAGLVFCLWRGHSLRMWAVIALLFDIDCICEMSSCLWGDSWPEACPLSMAGNARKGPHCIGIVFLCQEWRLWGLFFAGRSFAMKLMLSPIGQNVFLVAHHSAFLELLTLQKGPIVPFSVTTPPFGGNGRFGGARRRCALLVVCCLSLDAWCPPFVVWSLLPSAGLFALSLVARRPRPPGSVARRLRPAAAPDARVFLLALAPLRLRNAPPRRSLADVCYSLIAACLIFVAPPAAVC